MVRLHVLVSLLLVRVAQSLTGESEIDVTGDTISSVTIESPSSVIVSPTFSESSVPVLVHNLTWESLLYSQYSGVMLFQQMPYVYSIPVDASDNVECENYLTYVKWSVIHTFVHTCIYIHTYMHTYRLCIHTYMHTYIHACLYLYFICFFSPSPRNGVALCCLL